MAFKAEELTTKILPMLAAGGCPQDTVSKGKPPCPQNSHAPCPGGTNAPCPQDTAPTTGPGHGPGPGGGKKSTAGLADLALLRTQLREQLAQA